MKKLKLIGGILRHTRADRVIAGFIAFMLISATIIWLNEPGIRSWGEAFWYCFTLVSTIGFGDVVVTTALSRGLSIALSVYATVALAIFTGVIVNYFLQLVQLRQKDTLAALLDKLERLPELSKEELAQLSEQVRNRSKL